MPAYRNVAFRYFHRQCTRKHLVLNAIYVAQKIIAVFSKHCGRGVEFEILSHGKDRNSKCPYKSNRTGQPKADCGSSDKLINVIDSACYK